MAKVSVIIPTYNEKDNIAPLVERLSQALAGYDYEVMFIDDNSRDGTAELIQSLAAKYPIEVVVRRDKKGLASAVVDGFGFARGETMVVMDADLQHPPEVIPGLLKAIDSGADIAIASRYVKGGRCEGWGLVRRVISKGAIFLAHLFLHSTRQITDPMSGFFAIKRPVIAKASLKPTGYKILLEILIEGHFNKVAEVPYTFRTRSAGESKLGMKQQVDYLKHLYSLMMRRGELWRFLKFCMVGGSGVVVNWGLFSLLFKFAGLHYQFAAAISIETSIISNFVLNDFFTFADRRAPGRKLFLGRLLKFNLVSLPGWAINQGVLTLLTETFGIDPLLSQAIGIAAAVLWNYILNSLWTWK